MRAKRNRPNRTAMSGAHRAQPPQQSRRCGHAPSANRPDRAAKTDAHRVQNAPNKTTRAGAHRAQTPRTKPQGADAYRAQTAATEPQMRMHIKRNRPDRAVEADAPNAEHPDSPNQPAAACPNSEFRIPHSEFRISPAVPPRAQTPVPALKPASTMAAPAHNSLSCEAEYRFFASARSGVCGRKARRSYSYAEQETP